MILRVTEQHFEEINKIGRLRYPNEAVGLIVKHRVIELPNRSLNPSRQFLVNMGDIPLALEVTDMILTPEDWEAIIFWHTHPGGLVGPSQTDTKTKTDHFYHLVVTLTDQGPIPTFY